MDESVFCYLKSINRAEKTTFFSSIVFGLVTHLHIFSINYIFHDSVDINTLGVSYTSGRWSLGLLEEAANRFAGVYQLPFINGFISLLFIALVAMMFVNALEIKSITSAAFVGMISVAFPVVAAQFAFMFTATAYFFSMLISVFSVFLFYKKPNLLTFLLGSVLLCFAMGIYQAYFSLAVSFALVLMLAEGLRSYVNLSTLIRKCFLFLLMLLLGLLLYLAVNNVFLSIKAVELSNYQGLDKMGNIDMTALPKAIKQAYKDQISCIWLGVISSEFERNLTRIISIIGTLLFANLLRKEFPVSKKLFLVLLFILLPLAFNLVYPMSPSTMAGVHALMRFALVFTYILPVVFIELLPAEANQTLIRRAISTLMAIMLWLAPIVFCYKDNTAYLNAELVEEQAEAYYGSLVTRIRSVEGYNDDFPIAYIGFGITDSTLTKLPTFGNIYTYVLSFSLQEMVTTDRWQDFCAVHLGWSPKEVDDVYEYAQMSEVLEMPCYPDDGSIRVINDVVVVKFSQPLK